MEYSTKLTEGRVRGALNRLLIAHDKRLNQIKTHDVETLINFISAFHNSRLPSDFSKKQSRNLFDLPYLAHNSKYALSLHSIILGG